MSEAAMTGPALNTAELARQLTEQCGVLAGQILIVHSSLASLGTVDGGAAAVVAALKQVLGAGGTLLMPVFSTPVVDDAWDMAATPSRTGAITEAFRISPGIARSFSPTHSVAAWGARAAEFTAGHELTTPLGVGSPFHKAALAGAEVLMIGCDLTSCSLVHVAEAIVRAPYLGKVCYQGYDQPLMGVAADGRRHRFMPVDVPGDSQGFTKAQRELDSDGLIARPRLGAATCLMFPALSALDRCVAMLRRDPGCLLCANPRCQVCVPSKRILENA